MGWQRNSIIFFWWLALLVMLPGRGLAQEAGPAQEEYFREEIMPEGNDREWNKAAEGIDFGSPAPDEKEEEQQQIEQAPPAGGSSFFANSQVAQIILFTLAALLLAYILIRLFWGNKLFLGNKKIDRKRSYTSADEAEADAPLSELEQYLADAKGAQNWQLAVRLYFLMILGQLSDKQVIHWKKDKTNRQFFLELQSAAEELAPSFRKLSAFYERVWYGKRTLTQSEFEEAETHFTDFLNSIRDKRIAA